MKRLLTGLLLAVFMVSWALPVAAAPPRGNRVYFGGGIGLSFGTVDYFDLSALVGYRITERISAGVRVGWRYRSDDRFQPSLTTNDYGGALFGRYRIARPLYAHVEYEYLNYEFLRFDGSSDRKGYDSVLGGLGFVQPLGGHASFLVTALYNFTYSDSDPGPYSDPWLVRAGIAFGF